MGDKTAIQNRHGLKMLIRFIKSDIPSDKLAIVQHGYSGSMDEPHIKGFGETFLKNGYNVLMMDCTNNFNDADGEIEQNTIQTHYDDLEDVIKWAATQDWYKEPFALAGHSLGGLAVLTYAQNYLEKISLLFPAATVISGHLLEEAFSKNRAADYADVKNTGKMLITCSYKENKTGYRYYSWFTGMYGWNGLNKAEKLNMPVLFVVGSEDGPTPPEHQKLLYNALSTPKEIHVVQEGDHCYVPHLDRALTHLDNWLKKHA